MNTSISKDNAVLACIFQIHSETFGNAPCRTDGESISNIITRYAFSIGCTHSNTQAAVTWALKTPEEMGTLAALREGRTRADNLLFRQKMTENRYEQI